MLSARALPSAQPCEKKVHSCIGRRLPPSNIERGGARGVGTAKQKMHQVDFFFALTGKQFSRFGVSKKGDAPGPRPADRGPRPAARDPRQGDQADLAMDLAA